MLIASELKNAAGLRLDVLPHIARDAAMTPLPELVVAAAWQPALVLGGVNGW